MPTLDDYLKKGRRLRESSSSNSRDENLSAVDKYIILGQRGSEIQSPSRGYVSSYSKTRGEVFAPRISRVAGIRGFEGEDRTDSVVSNLGLDAKEMGESYVTLFKFLMEDPAGTAKAIAINFGPAIIESYSRWVEAYNQGVFLEAVQDHPLQAAQDLALPFLALTGVAGTAAGVISKGGRVAKVLARAAKIADRVNTVLDPIGAGAFYIAGKGVRAGLKPVTKGLLKPVEKSAEQLMNIAVDPVVEKVPLKSKMSAMSDAVQQGLIDQFYPIRKLGREFEAVKEGAPLKKAGRYIDTPLEQKIRLYSGFEEKVTEALRNGMPDVNQVGLRLARQDGRQTSQGLAKTFNELDPALWPQLRDYATSKRAVDLSERGIESGMDLDKAQKVISEIEGSGTPESRNVLNTWTKWRQASDDMLEYYQQGGMISKESADNFRRLNPNYVPFFRELGEEGKKGGAFKIKAIKGSEKPIKDPMESSLLLAGQMMRNVEVNSIIKELLPMADQPGTGVRLKKLSDATKLADDLDFERFVDNGFEELDNAASKASGTVPFYQNGQKYMIELDDPLTLQAFAALRATGDNKINEFFGSRKLLELPRKLAQLKRAGITLSPGFTLGLNMLRDTVSASVNTRFGFKPVYSNVRGAMNYIKKGELFDLWAASGGMQAELSALDRPALKERLSRYLDPNNRGYLNKIKNNVLHPIEFLQALQRFSEATTRLGEFEAGIRRGINQAPGESVQQAIARARAEGMDVNTAIRKAAVSSRDISTDFGIKPGNAFIRAWNMLTPFQNAQMQSLDLLRRKLTTGTAADKAKFAARAGLFVTIPSMITQIPLMNDREYQDDVPQFEKDLFWHMRLPDNFPVLPGKLARIPKPFEIGLIFGSLPERTLQSISQQDPSTMLNLVDRVTKDFQPFQFPAAFQLPLEVYTDYDFFYEAPLTPATQKRFKKSEQALPSTSQLSRVLSRWTEYISEAVPGKKPFDALLSPIQIEKLIVGTTGSIGKGILDVTDPLIATREIVQPDPKSGTAGRIPIVNRLLSNPSKRSQMRSDFFDIFQAHEKVLNSLSDPRLPESEKKSLYEDQRTLQNARMLRSAAQKIFKLTKRQRQIEYSRQIRSSEEKRRLIDQLDKIINVIAKQALDRMK